MLSGFPQPHPCWAHGWMLSGFGPLPRREHPASASMAFGGSYLPASWQGWRETKKDQTNSCCCCTAQEAWSIYQFEQASQSQQEQSDECCLSQLQKGHPAPALWDNWDNWAHRAQKKSEQHSAMSGFLQTHMAALFPNHRVEEDMPKDLKVNQNREIDFANCWTELWIQCEPRDK